MLDQTFQTAQADCQVDNFQTLKNGRFTRLEMQLDERPVYLHKLLGFLQSAKFETDHAAEIFHLFLCQLMLRVTGETGVPHLGDLYEGCSYVVASLQMLSRYLGMFFEELRNGHGVLAVTIKAQRQCL